MAQSDFELIELPKILDPNEVVLGSDDNNFPSFNNRFGRASIRNQYKQIVAGGIILFYRSVEQNLDSVCFN